MTSQQKFNNWRYVVDFLREYVPGLTYVVTTYDGFGDNAVMWGGFALWVPNDAPVPINDP